MKPEWKLTFRSGVGDKAEAARVAVALVSKDDRRGKLPKLAEIVGEGLVRGLVGEAPNEEFPGGASRGRRR